MNNNNNSNNHTPSDDPPDDPHRPPGAPLRGNRNRRPPARYGFAEFENPYANVSTSSYVAFRSQRLRIGAAFWAAVIAVFSWFDQYFGNLSNDPYANRSEVHLRVLPSRMCNYDGLGLFVVGPPNGRLPRGSIIPFKGIFVRRNSPWHWWAPWSATAQHSQRFVFIADPRDPLPDIRRFGTYRIVPYANYANAPWRHWQGPLPRELQSRAVRSSNAKIICNYRRGLCFLRTKRDIRVGEEVLVSYRW